MANRNTQLQSTWLHIAIVIVAVLVAYSKIFGAGFMSWDDIDYLYNTPDIKGFSAEHFKNWWTEFYIGNYQPLPMMSYAFDHMLAGDSAFVFHLDNIVWHIADAIILYACIKRLNGNGWIALFVALLFAIHPVQTESVSWVAARNKMMNGFFFLLAMYVYIGYVWEHSNKKLLLVILLGLAAYLCKLTAVTLPFALFAVDIWLERPLNKKRVWLEKLPLILLAIPIGIYNLQAQDEVAFLGARGEFNLLNSIVYAGYAYVQYIVNLLFPVRLSVLYPYPTGIGAIHLLYLLIAIAIVTGAVIAYRKKLYVLCGGIVFFTVNTAVVLQFVQFGEVLMADRYLYLACIGIWYPAVYYIWNFYNKKQTQRTAAIISLSLLSMAFTIVTYSRNDIWLSELNFWNSIIEKFPESSVAQSSLGGVYMNEGKNDVALTHINKALEADPSNYKAWYNKSVVLLRSNDTRGALSAVNKAISIRSYSKALFTRALIYQQTGRCRDAIADIRQVLEEEPYNAKAHYILADCSEQNGDVRTALNEYTKAIEQDNSDPLFYLRRGLVYARIGDTKNAIDDMSNAIQLNSNYAEAWYWRGMIKYRNGQNPCDDLYEAQRLGMKEASEAFTQVCGQQ